MVELAQTRTLKYNRIDIFNAVKALANLNKRRSKNWLKYQVMAQPFVHEGGKGVTLTMLTQFKYLRIRKLQFINTSYNLLTKFFMEKISYFHFFSFLRWYEVHT